MLMLWHLLSSYLLGATVKPRIYVNTKLSLEGEFLPSDLESINQSSLLISLMQITIFKNKKIIRKQQGCEKTVKSSSQAAFLNLNLIKSTIVIISDN